MNIKLNQDEFNTFIMLYAYAVMYDMIDVTDNLSELKIDDPYKRSRIEYILEQLDDKRAKGRLSKADEIKALNEIYELIGEFEGYRSKIDFLNWLSQMENKSIDDWLLHRYFKQKPYMKTQLLRIIHEMKKGDVDKINILI